MKQPCHEVSKKVSVAPDELMYLLLCRHLRVLDLIEDYVEEEDDEVVDWISKFPLSNTSLESLMFDCIRVPFNFEALEALVARSPSLRRLRVNHHVSVEQLRRLMARAPQLTHLGTGAFRTDAPQGGGISVSELAPSFAASRSIVCLSGFQEVNPEYLPAIYPVCGNLTSLNVSFASLTAEDLTPVIRQCHKLQTFWVCPYSYLFYHGESDRCYLFLSLELNFVWFRFLILWAMKASRLWLRHAQIFVSCEYFRWMPPRTLMALCQMLVFRLSRKVAESLNPYFTFASR